MKIFFSVGIILSITLVTSALPHVRAEDDPLRDLESTNFKHESAEGTDLKGESNTFSQYLNEAERDGDNGVISLYEIDSESRIGIRKDDVDVGYLRDY